MKTIAVVFRTVGWVLASIGYNSIIGSLPAGPITDLVRTLDLVLTPQVGVLYPFVMKTWFPASRQLLKHWQEMPCGQSGTWLLGSSPLQHCSASLNRWKNKSSIAISWCSFLGFSNCGKHNHRRTLEIHNGRKNCHSDGFKVLFSSIISSLH